MALGANIMAVLAASRPRVSLYVIAVLLSLAACRQPGKNDVRHFDFSKFANASRITIVGLGGVTVGVVDPDRVHAAARYFAGRQDGWTEAWKGPTAGVVALRFSNNATDIGEFQIDKDYLVYGAYHLTVPAEEINVLVKTLGVDVFHLPKQ